MIQVPEAPYDEGAFRRDESFLVWGDLREAGLVRAVPPPLCPLIKG